MEKRIMELLEDKGGNYILPFFWQHGEDEATLRDYMRAINDCGIRAVCVECRPHPDFCGAKWWEDFDIIMDEARTRGMKVWLLDDAHFPTGFANGKMKEADPALCKQYINYNHADISGPVPQASLDVAAMAKYTPNPFESAAASMFSRGVEPRVFDDDKLLAVVAVRVLKDNRLDSEAVDLTARVADGKITWDVPNGLWRVFVVFNTKNGGGRTDYINVIDYDSVRVLIDNVYEPHYERYKADFGKTFVGFFSDEPLFGNTYGFNFDESIGRKKMPLPWNKDVPEMLRERLGDAWVKQLPALWAVCDDNDKGAKARYAYMDTVTRLVEKNFSNHLGEWCSERGVEYIGHIIEDNNQHSRLGCSLGHFFRGLSGQHMAGIDDIGNQVLLGGENHLRGGGITPPGDGEFYHFALGKLASSHAHIDPKKLGRAMCELFGAYGWSCGVRLMKYITDHFLVRGVNQFVPHAFSPKEFPDPDCPPHFYAHGHNPQYRHFQKLMFYMNRVCHLTNGGRHIAPAALLYHGEAEWSGDYMYLQKPARELMESQIDFDILPPDIFEGLDKELHVNGETYQTLIVPYAEYITKAVADFAARSAVEVIFIDKLPSGICEGGVKPDLSACTVVALEDLADYMTEKGYRDIKSSVKYNRLRYYRYRHDNDIFLFSNEDPGLTYEGEITVPAKGDAVIYDAYDNVLRPLDYKACADGTKLHLKIEPYQMVIVAFGDDGSGKTTPAPSAAGKKTVLTGEWTLSLCEDAREYPNFGREQKITKLENIGQRYPDFSGFLRYETVFSADACKMAVLELENAYEGVEVWVNGENAGIAIAPPYRFDISKLVKPGENVLRVEVATTLDRKVRAMPKANVSPFFRGSPIMEPTGIVGDVWVYTD